MDPNATLDIVLDDSVDPVDRVDAIDALVLWVENGGYLPRLHGRLTNRTFGGNTAARYFLLDELRRRRLPLVSALG